MHLDLTDHARLERQLREKLRSVELVCEAEIGGGELADAETHVRRTVEDRSCEMLSDHPAVTVVYFALAGAARYEGNRLWPQLGIPHAKTSVAGEAFLCSLRRLGLPDFQDMVRHDGARKYVTPILIHGGLPAVDAEVLVGLIEEELGRGLIDGAEARRRLLHRSDLVQKIGRPGKRLLTYAPEYADLLLEAVIDYLTLRPPHRRHLLPAHLQRALSHNSAAPPRHHRLRPPEVVLEIWSGMGPQVVGRDRRLAWTLERNETVDRIEFGECVELSPDETVLARGKGRRVELWSPRQVAFFDGAGVLLPPGKPLPVDCIVLHDRSCTLHVDGHSAPRVAVDAAPLSGQWSRFVARQLDLSGVTALEVRRQGSLLERHTVATAVDVTLLGEPVPWMTGPRGEPVFRTPPRLCSGPRARVSAWFTPDGLLTDFRALEADANGTIDLVPLIGERAVAGRLEVRTTDGGRSTHRVTLVPGLDVQICDRALGPGDRVTVVVRDPAGWVAGDSQRPVGEARAELPVEVTGANRFTVTAHLPRVRWGLRTDELARVDIASRTLRAEREDLIARAHYLIVRHGRPSQVVLELTIDGEAAQRLRGTTMAAEPGVYSCAFDLTRLRDTLRHAQGTSVIELRLQIDGTSIVAVRCGGEARADTTAWQPLRRSAAADDDTALDTGDAGVFRRLQPSDQVVRFLEQLGRASRVWRTDGLNEAEWNQLCHIADSLWHTEGVRYRIFNGKDLSRLRTWARHARQELEKLPDPRRAELDRWVLRAQLPVSVARSWEHADWVRVCLGGSDTRMHSTPAVAVATLLWRAAEVLHGEPTAAVLLGEAVDVTPGLIPGLMAFLLIACRETGGVRRPPQVEDHLEEEATDGAEAVTDEPSTPILPLIDLATCTLDVDGTRLVVTSPAPCRFRHVRVIAGRRPHALLATVGGPTNFSVDLPADLGGEVQVQAVESPVPCHPDRATVTVELTALPPKRPPVSVSVSGGDLRRLADLRLEALIRQIAEDIDDGRVPVRSIEELFEDESRAAAALVRWSLDQSSRSLVTQVAIAVMPSAHLFATLGVGPDDLTRLLQTSPLMYAALAPKTPSAWQRIGWPNPSRFTAGDDTYVDLISFASRLHRPITGGVDGTWRYAALANGRFLRLERTIAALDGAIPTPGFVDLATVAHRQLAIEEVTIEATRALLAAYRTAAKTTVATTLVGIAAHLAVQSSSRGAT